MCGKHHHAWRDTSGAILLVGLGILFLLGAFWPWILVVIGLAGLQNSVARKGLWAGMQGFIWMVGFAFLFAFDIFWPGILIVAGLSMLAGTIAPPPVRKKRKRKRGLPPDDFSAEEPYGD